MNIRKLIMLSATVTGLSALGHATWSGGLQDSCKSLYIPPTQQSGWDCYGGDASLAELQAMFSEADVQRNGDSVVLVYPERVFFDSESSTVRNSGRREIENIARWMREHPEQTAQVRGFADSTGPAGFNRNLSEDRAAVVADGISSHGVSDGRISAAGYGEKYPAGDNDTPYGRQVNRRVEIYIQSQ